MSRADTDRVSGGPGADEIFVMSAGGANPTNRTNAGGSDEGPADWQRRKRR